MSKTLSLVFVVAAFGFAGCKSAPTESPTTTAESTKAVKPVSPPTTTSSSTMAMNQTKPAAKGVVKNGLYVSAKGVPLCPITGEEVEKGKEVGKTVYKGVEYHFCCASCPDEFQSHPATYAVK